MKKMFSVDTQQCTGCGACVNACSVGAIQLVEDPYGFSVALIDESRCVGCGACQRSCPAVNPIPLSRRAAGVYAATNRDLRIQTASTSAGVFYSLARSVIRQGGVVFGCAWEDGFTARHICVCEEAELKRLQKSKYVQSDMGLCYREAESCLKEGKQVLFSGTPCQIAGFRAYLKKDYDNLLLVDFVCHGVPNRRILAGFIESQEKERGARITALDFRHKTAGLSSYITRIAFSGKHREKILLEPWQGTSYGYLFMRSYITRESCYNCRYASCERVSDITLADYWGVRQAHPQIDTTYGVGLVIVSSEKGSAWLSCLGDELVLVESTMEAAVKGNSQLRGSPEKPDRRDALMEEWSREGYAALERFYRSRRAETAGPRRKFRLLCCLPRQPMELLRRIKKKLARRGA